MKTKNVLFNRMQAVGMDNRVFFEFPLHTFIVQKFPYGKTHHKNSMFHFLCQFLEPNTNMLCFFGIDNIAMPATPRTLSRLSGKSLETFTREFDYLISDGIIMRVYSGKLSRYYINPNFAIAGDNLPIFLYEMFEVSDTKMLGEHLFSKDGELYNNNRNKDGRFGDLKNIRTYTKVTDKNDPRLKRNIKKKKREEREKLKNVK